MDGEGGHQEHLSDSTSAPPGLVLLGMQWEGGLFVDTTLPFGLRSAPKIFTALTDAVEWTVKRRGFNSASTTWTTT